MCVGSSWCVLHVLRGKQGLRNKQRGVPEGGHAHASLCQAAGGGRDGCPLLPGADVELTGSPVPHRAVPVPTRNWAWGLWASWLGDFTYVSV